MRFWLWPYKQNYLFLIQHERNFLKTWRTMRFWLLVIYKQYYLFLIPAGVAIPSLVRIAVTVTDRDADESSTTPTVPQSDLPHKTIETRESAPHAGRRASQGPCVNPHMLIDICTMQKGQCLTNSTSYGPHFSKKFG